MASEEQEAAAEDTKVDKMDVDEDERYTLVDLLSTFKRSFMKDETIFNFDYIRFWEQCSTLLDTWMEGAAKTLAQSYFTIDNDQDPWMLAWKVLCELGETAGGDLHQTTLKKLAEIMEDQIKGIGGNDFRQKALNKSSGHIPKKFTPNCARKYAEWKTKPEARRYDPLKAAGTSYSIIVKLATLYHPRLSESDMDRAVASALDCKGQVLTWYMVQTEEQHENELAL